MKKQVKNANENLNTIVYFDEENYNGGMDIMNENLAKYKGLKNAFKTITDNDAIIDIDALNTFICSKSGFPNLRASVQLLDWETDYDFILNNIDKVDLFLIDAENDCIPASVENAFRIEKTVRLNDLCEHDYQVLLKVNELFKTLNFTSSYHAINETGVNVFMLNENYRLATQRTY